MIVLFLGYYLKISFGNLLKNYFIYYFVSYVCLKFGSLYLNSRPTIAI